MKARAGEVWSDEELLASGKAVLVDEARELEAASKRIGLELVEAARLIHGCQGRVVVVGLGKSGLIGRKIAATLASLATPAFFLHAAEGVHGDLGMVRSEDVGLFISNSGETREVLELLPFFRRIGASVIALTGRSASRLGREADVTLLTTVAREADPLGLAPTSSTTVQLGVGDALAVMVTRLRGLRQEDFALFHPGGALGRKLLLRVDDLMGPPERLPSVGCHASVQDALFEITSKGYGATCVVDDEGLLVGVFTDGDLRRLLERRGVQAMEGTIAEAMTTGPKTIGADRLAVEALRLMESWEVTVLIVVDGGRPRAMIHLHELLKAGLA
jgi:arabinose-5-phosphate isomerase